MKFSECKKLVSSNLHLVSSNLRCTSCFRRETFVSYLYNLLYRFLDPLNTIPGRGRQNIQKGGHALFRGALCFLGSWEFPF